MDNNWSSCGRGGLGLTYMTTSISHRVSTMLNRSNSSGSMMSTTPHHLSSLTHALVPDPSSPLKPSAPPTWEDLEAACASRVPLGRRSKSEGEATVGSKSQVGTTTWPGSVGPQRASIQIQDLHGGVCKASAAQAGPLVPHHPPPPAASQWLGPPLACCELVASLQHLDIAIPQQVGGPPPLHPRPYLDPDPRP